MTLRRKSGVEVQRGFRPGVRVAATLALVVEATEDVGVLHVAERMQAPLGRVDPALRHVDVGQHLASESAGEGIGASIGGDAAEGGVHRAGVGEIIAQAPEPDQGRGSPEGAGLSQRVSGAELGLRGKWIVDGRRRRGCGDEGREEEAGDHGGSSVGCPEPALARATSSTS